MSRVRQTAKRLLDGKGQVLRRPRQMGAQKKTASAREGDAQGRGGGKKAGEKTFTSFRTYSAKDFRAAASVTHRLRRFLERSAEGSRRGRNSGKRGEAWDSCETAASSRASLRHFLSCFGGYALCLGTSSPCRSGEAGAILDDVLMAVLCSLYRSRSAASCPRIISATRSCSSRNSCIISGVAGTG